MDAMPAVLSAARRSSSLVAAAAVEQSASQAWTAMRMTSRHRWMTMASAALGCASARLRCAGRRPHQWRRRRAPWGKARRTRSQTACSRLKATTTTFGGSPREFCSSERALRDRCCGSLRAHRRPFSAGVHKQSSSRRDHIHTIVIGSIKTVKLVYGKQTFAPRRVSALSSLRLSCKLLQQTTDPVPCVFRRTVSQECPGNSEHLDGSFFSFAQEPRRCSPSAVSQGCAADDS